MRHIDDYLDEVLEDFPVTNANRLRTKRERRRPGTTPGDDAKAIEDRKRRTKERERRRRLARHNAEGFHRRIGAA